MKKYIHYIQSGEKTVEGRINSGMFKNIHERDLLRFFYMANPHDDVYCKVLEKRVFRTFKEMLQHYGFKACVPDEHSLEGTVRVYMRIPRYAQKEQQFGVIGFKIELLARPEDATQEINRKSDRGKRSGRDRYPNQSSFPRGNFQRGDSSSSSYRRTHHDSYGPKYKKSKS